MEKLDLKLTTKTVECEITKIKTAIIIEEGVPEIVIPKNLIKKIKNFCLRK